MIMNNSTKIFFVITIAVFQILIFHTSLDWLVFIAGSLPVLILTLYFLVVSYQSEGYRIFKIIVSVVMPCTTFIIAWRSLGGKVVEYAESGRDYLFYAAVVALVVVAIIPSVKE